jgi:hypothetical protein
MANEVTVPLLPCASIDDIEAFYGVLGFRTTYKQRKPNACVAVQREDLHLQFFEIAGFDPEQSYGSCLVLTADIDGLHRAFAAGMRAAYGKVLVSGTPRMTRPRARRNADGWAVSASSTRAATGSASFGTPPPRPCRPPRLPGGWPRP